jgi:hypothetical protein
LAHAVIWTNWGHPVLSFDFFVPAKGVQPFNVRDLLRGSLPETAPPSPLPEGLFGSCTTPLAAPVVDPEELVALLSGAPHPVEGLCYSAAVEDGELVTGFVTVDVVQDCSGAALVTPDDPGYLGDCASGLASNDNLLWGDFFLIDPGENFAQGEKLVSLVADQTRFGVSELCVDPPCGDRIPFTFYAPGGNRMPLATTYETRFLSGGGFDGGTDFLVWLDGKVGPLPCGEGPEPGASRVVAASFRNEAGQSLSSHNLSYRGQSFRATVGGDDLPITDDFGCVELRSRTASGGATAPEPPLQQLYVLPLLSARGRYSVGLGAIPTADLCSW